MGVVYAHDLAAELYEPLPEGLFQYKFDWDPTLLFFLILAFCYIRGMRAFRGRLPIAKWQVACFFLGVFFNVLALSPPIDPLSDRLFFMHMIQHMLIVQVGTPLMLLGVPYYIVSRGLSVNFRRYIYFPIIKNRFLRKVNNLFLFPIISLFLFECNFWFWHVPRFYNWALLNDFIHLLEHALMAITSFYLWRNIIDPYPLKCRLHMGLRLLYMASIMVLNTVLAAALTYASKVWYAYEGIPMPKWWAYRWDHLDDQRLGGLIMWIPGGFLTFLSMTICFFVWVQREQKSEIQKTKQMPDSENIESKSHLAPV